MKKLEHWILHPFLLGAYPVIALLAYNMAEINVFSALRPVILALVAAAITLWVLNLLLKNRHRAALVTSFLLLLVFLYGHAFNLIEKAYIAGIEIGHHRYLAILWLILLVVGLWAIIKKIQDPQRWTRPLNVFGLLLLVFQIIQILIFQVNSYISIRQADLSVSNSIVDQLNLPAGDALPDIYYIILDTYTRGDTLQEVFGYDNSAFLNSLEQRGFYIGNCSQSNYSYTEASLTSSLNMQFLDVLDEKFAPPNQSTQDMMTLLQNNVTMQTLRDLGYTLVAFESGYPPTEFHNADVYFSPQSTSPAVQVIGSINSFEAMLFQTTIGRLFLDMHLFPRGLENTLFDSAYLLHRDRILYEFDKVVDASSIPGPKISFVHILAPHNPFVFGPDGEVLLRTTPFTLNGDVDAMELTSYIAGYSGQVSYLDKLTLETVDAILANSNPPPIIIVQGDHGSPRTPGWNMTILNAYYFPDENGRALLYPSISPVNTFRVVFNAYMGSNLDLLNDLACNSRDGRPYECQVLPDPNPQCAVATP